MANIKNERDLALQATVPRLIATSISISSAGVARFTKLKNTNTISPSTINISTSTVGFTTPTRVWSYASSSSVSSFTSISETNITNLTSTLFLTHLGTGTFVRYKCVASQLGWYTTETYIDIGYTEQANDLPVLNISKETLALPTTSLDIPTYTNAYTDISVTIGSSVLSYAIGQNNAFSVSIGTIVGTATVTPSTSTNVRRLSISGMNNTGLTSTASIPITITVQDSRGTITVFEKTLSVSKVTSGTLGVDAVSISLLSPTGVFPADNDGTNYASIPNNAIILQKGLTIQAATSYGCGSTAGTQTATVNGLIATVVVSTGIVTFSGTWASDTAVFTFNAVYSGVTYTTTYTIAKAKKGNTGLVPDISNLINKTAVSVLTGNGAIKAGTIDWDVGGTLIGGTSGVAMTSTGIVGVKATSVSTSTPSFTLGIDGAATFMGDINTAGKGIFTGTEINTSSGILPSYSVGVPISIQYTLAGFATSNTVDVPLMDSVRVGVYGIASAVNSEYNVGIFGEGSGTNRGIGVLGQAGTVGGYFVSTDEFGVAVRARNMYRVGETLISGIALECGGKLLWGDKLWPVPPVGTVAPGSEKYLCDNGTWKAVVSGTPTFDPQLANTVLAAPVSSTGTPTFRTLLAQDIPLLNQNTTGTATLATNLVGGTTGRLAYQSNIDTTAFATTANYGVVVTSSTGIPSVLAGTAGVLLGSASTTPIWTVTPTLQGTNFTQVPVSSLTGTTIPSTVVTSSLTSVGTLTSIKTTSTVSVNDIGIIDTAILTTSTTAVSQVIETLSISTYRAASFKVTITSGSVYQYTEVNVLHDGTNVFINEINTMSSGASLATFTADILGGNVRLLTTPVNATTTYKVVAILIAI